MKDPADAQKAYIMDSFKLYGVVVNRDVDNDNNMQKERIARAFTCTVKNVCHVLDYFSKKGDILKRYNSCYFVLKKVKIEKGMSWENVLTASNQGTGSLKVATPAMEDTLKWQIVPYHNTNNVLEVSKRLWDDGQGITRVGGMWKLGRIHEFADICIPSAFERRTNEHSVARDIGLLHGRGRITPIHFYLHIQTHH
jgi:hypothetical protein